MTDTTASQQLHTLRLEMIELKSALEVRSSRDRSLAYTVAMCAFVAAVLTAVLIVAPTDRQRQSRSAASLTNSATMPGPTYNCVVS